MNLQSCKKYVKVSLVSALIWSALTYAFLRAGLVEFAEANATERNIQIGALGITASIMLLVLFSFLGNEKISLSLKEKILGVVSFFAAIAFSSLAACLVYYSASGWYTALSVYLAGSILFWLSTITLLFIISNIDFKATHRLILCSTAAMVLIGLTYAYSTYS